MEMFEGDAECRIRPCRSTPVCFNVRVAVRTVLRYSGGAKGLLADAPNTIRWGGSCADARSDRSKEREKDGCG